MPEIKAMQIIPMGSQRILWHISAVYTGDGETIHKALIKSGLCKTKKEAKDFVKQNLMIGLPK